LSDVPARAPAFPDATPAAPAMLRTRVVTAVVAVCVVLTALFLLPSRIWGMVALLVFVGAAYEWTLLIKLRKQASLLFAAGTGLMALSLLFAPAFQFARGWPAGIVLIACGGAAVFWLVVAPLWVVGRWRAPARWLMALLGWVVLIGAWVALVELQARSPWLVLTAMGVVWIADTAAYFAGRAFGRNKLAPLVSPGKTWEGVYGAVAAVIAYALLLVPFAHAAGFNRSIDAPTTVAWIAFAAVVTAVSIIGDLYESLLKRQAGVKDSGFLLPGHGGILDRLDAQLAALPVLAIAAQLLLAKAPV